MHRLTKIICTLGPSCSQQEDILQLQQEGMSIARINMSHGSWEQHADLIGKIKQINESKTVPIGILLDTKGAEIRTGEVTTPLEITKDQEVLFCPPAFKEKPEDITCIEVNYDRFAEDVAETEIILLDNGEFSFDIIEIRNDGSVLAKAKEAGTIESRRHVNLPGADVDLPSVTRKDWEDIEQGLSLGIDFLALSFIRTAEEVQAVRTFLDQKKANVAIITKIESQKALENIDDIITVSDGIMVARGDLGAEVPYEKLPSIQDSIVKKCIQAGKPVIVATHMLESMKENAIPTRAEMIDVSHAATTLADSTMLSGETATGKHPPKAVEAMNKLLKSTEDYLDHAEILRSLSAGNEIEARAKAAVSQSHAMNIEAIVAFTKTGRTARAISKFRPGVPIIACTDSAEVQTALTLPFGVLPLYIPFGAVEQTVEQGLQNAKEAGLVNQGSTVIVVSDIDTERGAVWSVQLRTIA